MAWNKTYPTASTTVSGSTAQIRANWDAIDDWFDVEHHAVSSGTSGGIHKPGQVPVLYSGTTSEISALSSPESGALAFDTTLGTFKIKRSTWVSPTASSWSTAAASGSSQTISSGAWTKKTLTLEAVDLLSQFSSSKFTAQVAGYYLIIATIPYDTVATDGPLGSGINKVGIYVNGSLVSCSRMYRKGGDGHSLADIRYLSVNDYVELYYYTGLADGGTLGGGGYLHIVRLS